MAFTDVEKTDIRRFCGYPAFGLGNMLLGAWRFHQAYGLLEVRMNNLSDAETAVVRRYLTTLTALEQAVPRTGDNLDTDQASVWTHNRDELRDRIKLFENWRRRLCNFLGVPAGPTIDDGGITLVV